VGGRRNSGLGLWAHPPRGGGGGWREQRVLPAGEALGEGEGSGPSLPPQPLGQGLGPGRFSPGDRGSFGLKCWGGLPPAHHDAKSETRYRVFGCMDALCVHACVRGRQGPLMSQERALQRTWGRAEWGHASAGDPGGLAGGSGLGQGLGYTTSRLGLRDAMGMSLSPGVVSLLLHDWVSIDLCVQMSICLCSHVSTWKCSHSASTCGRICPRRCLPVATFASPPASVSCDYPRVCLHVWVWPTSS